MTEIKRDIQEIGRTIAVMTEVAAMAQEIIALSKAELIAADMARGSAAVSDDKGHEIGILIRPKTTTPKPVVHMDMSEVLANVPEEWLSVTLVPWAESEIRAEALIFHRTGERQRAGVTVTQDDPRPSRPSWRPGEDSRALVRGMVQRGSVNVPELLANGGDL